MPRAEDSIRRGVQEAARLHMALGTQAALVRAPGSVDVFDAVTELDIALLIRPLEGLLGAFVREPTPGILITSKRPSSVQRFTAAHELGHFYMAHEFSLDEPDLLRRSPFGHNGLELQELEANVFAASFLMPRWLVYKICQIHGWTAPDFEDAHVVYQLALRLGTSYSATVYTLQRYNLVSTPVASNLLATRPRDLKNDLLGEFEPANYYGDVWLITANDEGTVIAGSRNDHFVLKLKEHSTSGYLWNFDQLAESGFVIVRDSYENSNENEIGGFPDRLVTAYLEEAGQGRIDLQESRPWQLGNVLGSLSFCYDLTGPEEEGVSRAERRRRLGAA